MATPLVALPDPVRRKAIAAGPAGTAWLASLDILVQALAGEWRLTIGRTLAGGTEAAVLEVRTEDGCDAVLKLLVPGQDPDHAEARVLCLAAGRGYVDLLRHDPARSALLLERLGPSLHDLGVPADEAIPAICATLRRAWVVPPPAGDVLDGRAKAERLIAGMQTLWRDLGRPLSSRALAAACRAAELLAGDPVALARARCTRLSTLTSVPARPIWEWGTAERVSTGLVLLRIGMAAEADEFFAVAEACAEAEPP